MRKRPRTKMIIVSLIIAGSGSENGILKINATAKGLIKSTANITVEK